MTEIQDFLERDEIDVIGRVDGAGLAINLYKFNKHYGEFQKPSFVTVFRILYFLNLLQCCQLLLLIMFKIAKTAR